MDGKGLWSIERYQNYWVVRLEWKMRNGHSVNFGDMMEINKRWSKYTLNYTLGDPDLGIALVFSEVEPKN